MSKYQLPSDWSKPAATVGIPARVFANKEQPKPVANVTAKIDMGENVAGAGLCPACKKPMQKGFMAGSIPVMVCFDDRVTLPISDEEADNGGVEANSETGFLGVSFVDN